MKNKKEKIKKRKNFLTSLFAAAFLFAVLSVPTYAAAGEYFVNVTSDTVFVDTDVFKITIKSAKGAETTAEINAKDAGSMSYQLDEGTYTVTDITYQGVNQAIKTYGITKNFEVKGGDTTNVISLYVGEVQVGNATEELTAKGAEGLSASTGTDTGTTTGTTGTTTDTTGNTGSSEENTGTSEATSENASENTTGGTELKDPDEKKVVEEVKKDDEKEEKNSSSVKFSPVKLIYAFVFTCICGLIIYFKCFKEQ